MDADIIKSEGVLDIIISLHAENRAASSVLQLPIEGIIIGRILFPQLNYVGSELDGNADDRCDLAIFFKKVAHCRDISER